MCKKPKISETRPEPKIRGISGFGMDNPNPNVSQTQTEPKFSGFRVSGRVRVSTYQKNFKKIIFFLFKGHCYQSENNGGRGRANANQKDLNRNFPDQFHDGKDQASLLKGREPETLAAMKWIVSNPFILSGNLHGGSVVASYPFDDSPRASPWRSVYSKSPDDAMFRRLATLYASNHATMKTGNVCKGKLISKCLYGRCHRLGQKTNEMFQDFCSSLKIFRTHN